MGIREERRVGLDVAAKVVVTTSVVEADVDSRRLVMKFDLKRYYGEHSENNG